MPKSRKVKHNPVERYLKNGKENVKKKKISKALASFNKAIELDPKCVEAYFERARVYEHLEREKDALEDYNKATELDPSFAHAYTHRAFLYAALGKHKQALKELRKAYKIEPKKGELTYFLNTGNIYSMLGQSKKALEHYYKALKSKPAKSTQAGIHYNMAITYFRLEQHDKALNECDLALKLKPKRKTIIALILRLRGGIYGVLKQYDKALKDIEKAIELNPTFYAAHLTRGFVYSMKGQFDKALEIFRHAVDLQPKITEGYFRIGLTYEELRQFDKALEQYKEILVLDPKNAHVHTHIGIVYGNVHRFEEAIRYLTKAIKLNPKEDVAYYNRAIGYIETGKYDRALQDFETAIKLYSSFDLAHFGRGKALCYIMDGEETFKKRKECEQKIIESFKKASEITKDTELKELAKWWTEFFKKYCDASVENRNRLRVFAELYEAALEANLFSAIHDEQDRFVRFMNLSKTFRESECFFQVLRRWNSFTPVFPGTSRSNLGGGYFFACDGKGVVIDPGYNFIENFIENNFSLGDIDNIVLTHAHDDHTADFEAILSLLSKSRNDKKLNLFANLGASVKFANLVSKNESKFEEVQILNDSQLYQITPNLKMKATRAVHSDVLTEKSSKGLIFELKRGQKRFKIGITGDTMLFTNAHEKNGLYSLFEKVDLLILHIGSIHRREFEVMKDNFDTHKYDGEHLGIRGIVNLIFRNRPKLAIISEFGEELKDLRVIIAHKIDKSLDNYDSSDIVRVIPGDIGLKIVFDASTKVKCEICGSLVELKDIEYTETLINDKITYHCRHHQRSEIIDKFKTEEERKLRMRAESMGCTIDLISPLPHVPRFPNEKTV